MPHASPPPNDEISLPFDLATVARAILRRWPLMLLIIALAIGLGITAGLFLGARTYKANTVLHYRPASGSQGAHPLQSLASLLHQVKVRENTVELRERLQLPVELDRLGSSIDILVPRGSTLMHFFVSWDDPVTAARIANTIRDIFLEAWCRDLLSKVETLQEQAQTKLKTARTQEAVHESLMDQLRAQAEAERAKTGKGAAEISVRYSRVREMINEDRNTRVNAIEMAAREAEFQRATRLKEKGLISRPEFENAEAAYRRQQAMTQDSARSARLRRELDSLRSKAGAVETTTPAEETLQQVMITALGVKMERIEHEDQVATIEQALATARVNLEGLEKLKVEGLSTDEARQALTYDLLALQEPLVKVRALYDVESTKFSLVSEATPPVMSAKSTRKLLAVGVAGVVFLLGFTLIVLKALLTTRIRSGAEFRLAADVAPVGCVPRIKDPGKPDPRSQDAYRLLGRALQGAVRGEGTRVAVTGLSGGEGVSLVVFRLAELFGLLKGRALVIDVRSARPGHLTLTGQLLPDERPDEGLGTLLKRSKITLDDALAFVVPTALKGVYLLPNDGVPIPTDALGAHGFGALLEAVAPRYDIILLDTPPVLNTSTTVFLAEWCDATLVVARANQSRKADLKHAMERMRITETETLGVLNAVDPRLDPM